MTIDPNDPADRAVGDPAADAPSGGGLTRRGIALAILAAILLATGAVWGTALLTDMPLPGFELSAAGAAETMRDWGMGGVAVIIGLMVIHSFIPFPAEFCALAAGMVYGPLWGTVYVWIGAMLGALLSFGLARWLGRPFVEAMLARRQRHRIDEWTARQGASTLLFSRFIPVIAFNLINYAAGLTNMSWITFTWATGLGILPLTALMVLMGDQMTSLSWWHWAALTAFALVVWAAVLTLRRRASPGEARNPGPEA